MVHYRKSDYALNRNRTGIVYRRVNSIKEIGVQAFLEAHPEQTEQDFARWKQVSDQMYLEEKREEWRHSSKNISLDFIKSEKALTVPSAEDIYMQSLEQMEHSVLVRSQLNLAGEALNTLKRKQKRRFLLYVIHQLSMREIAEMEGVSHVAVYLSIQSARKKIEKFLHKHREPISYP